MTSIAFHFNAPLKLDYACRLLRKASASGSTVAVWADSALLHKLDEQLWRFSAQDFVPHALIESLTPLHCSYTPIWLCDNASQGLGRQVLLNLTQDFPGEIANYERVIEVVSLDEQDKQRARQRWKQYKDLGYEILRHDLNLNS
jgi:DNA polymerase III subunit chi